MLASAPHAAAAVGGEEGVKSRSRGGPEKLEEADRRQIEGREGQRREGNRGRRKQNSKEDVKEKILCKTSNAQHRGESSSSKCSQITMNY